MQYLYFFLNFKCMYVNIEWVSFIIQYIILIYASCERISKYSVISSTLEHVHYRHVMKCIEQQCCSFYALAQFMVFVDIVRRFIV